MQTAYVADAIGAVGAIIVGFFALRFLRKEWGLKGADVTVTKVMLTLLVIGCAEALLVGLRILGQTPLSTR
ncbi:MAG TPA: hypothetical protein VNJ51_07350 [Candidatus Dormibacteraeota bacterium]|nr:hypothetical protein [Candidatus Dormibacteraeota bacterium]